MMEIVARECSERNLRNEKTKKKTTLATVNLIPDDRDVKKRTLTCPIRAIVYLTTDRHITVLSRVACRVAPWPLQLTVAETSRVATEVNSICRVILDKARVAFGLVEEKH